MFHLDPSNRLATIHQRHKQTRQTDRTGQRSDSIGRTVLQTVAPKRFAVCYQTVVCPSCVFRLFVTSVYCGQTVGRIKMKHGMQVGFGPGHIVLDGDPAPPPPKEHSVTQFSAHFCCGQMASWIKMSLGMEIGLCPGGFVLDGDPPSPSPKRRRSPSPIFGSFLLWPNG